MHEVLVNRLGGLSLPRKSVVRLTDRPDMTLDVYRGRKTTIQQQQYTEMSGLVFFPFFSVVLRNRNKNSCFYAISADPDQTPRFNSLSIPIYWLTGTGKKEKQEKMVIMRIWST